MDRRENRDLLACSLRIKLMYESSALHFTSFKELAKKLDISVNTLKKYMESPLFKTYFRLDKERGTLVSRCLHRKKRNIRVDKVEGRKGWRWYVYFGEVRVMTITEEDLLSHKRLKSILERLAIMLRINEQNLVNHARGKKNIKASGKAVPTDIDNKSSKHKSDDDQAKEGPARRESEGGGDGNDRLSYSRRGTTISEPGDGGVESEEKGYLGCAYMTMSAKTGISLTRVKKIIGELDREGVIVRRRRMSISLQFEKDVPDNVRDRLVDEYMGRLEPVRGEKQIRLDSHRGVIRFKSNMYNLNVKGGNTALVNRPKRRNIFKIRDYEPNRITGVEPDIVNDRTVEDNVSRVVWIANDEGRYSVCSRPAPYKKRKMRMEVDFRMKPLSERFLHVLKKLTNPKDLFEARKGLDRFIHAPGRSQRANMAVFKRFINEVMSRRKKITMNMASIGIKDYNMEDSIRWSLEMMSNNFNYQELKSYIGWHGMVLGMMCSVAVRGVRNLNVGNWNNALKRATHCLQWEPLY